jgi:cell division protein FtsX
MHLFYLREASRSFRHHRGLAYTAILSLTGALTLSGIFLLLTHNAEHSLAAIGDRREMVVYLRDDVTASQRDVLVSTISTVGRPTSRRSRRGRSSSSRSAIPSCSKRSTTIHFPLPCECA